MSHSRRGAAAEALVTSRLLERGYQVCAPVPGQQLSFDVCVVRGENVCKIQVKRAYVRMRGGVESLRVALTDTNGNRYSTDAVDLYAVVDMPGNRVWMIPRWEVFSKEITVSASKYWRWLT